ncbi:MAG: FAD-binding oxidoreductase [Pseudomonadota bacterium]
MQHPNGPITDKSPIRFSDPLPDACDVAIIGGGVIGVCAAIYMADLGLSVVIIEKGRIAGEQSSRNWGWIRQHGRDYAELPIMMEANRLWEELDAQTGNNTGFKRGGVIYLASTEAELAKREQWLKTAREYQLDSRLIGRIELANLIQQGDGAHQWVGATWTPSDARAEPWQAVAALAELAQSKGVAFRENCAARCLDFQNGKVTGVVTEYGIVRCEQVVLAAGAWSSLFLQNHDISIPQLSIHSKVCRTAPMAKVLDGEAKDETLAFRRRADGGYTIVLSGGEQHFIGRDSFRHLGKWMPTAKQQIGSMKFGFAAPRGFPDAWSTARRWSGSDISPFEKVRVLSPAPEPAGRQSKMKRVFASRFPQLGEPEITHAWAGMIDAMPDVVPIVDRVPEHPNLIVATGMSGHGFGIGPGFGKIIARMAAVREAGHDMRRFRFSRFTDGSKLEIGPGL